MAIAVAESRGRAQGVGRPLTPVTSAEGHVGGPKRPPYNPAVPTLWIFEDQLSPDLPTLAAHPAAAVFMVESDRAFRQWRYHRKRVTFLCAAMRHFAADLRAAGRTVHYHPLRPDGYRDSLAAVRHHVAATGDRHFVVVDPADHHTRAWLDTLPAVLGITVDRRAEHAVPDRPGQVRGLGAVAAAAAGDGAVLPADAGQAPRAGERPTGGRSAGGGTSTG